MITFYFSSARSISFPHSLCFVDFHSTPLCCCMTYPPIHTHTHTHPIHSLIRFLSFSLQLFFFFFFFCLGVEVVNRGEGLVSGTVSLCVSFVQALLGQLPIHTVLPIRTPFREHERGHEMRSVTPSSAPPPPIQ